MFNLKKIDGADVLLVAGIALVAGGIAAIYWPAALIFTGISFGALAFLATPEEKGGGK